MLKELWNPSGGLIKNCKQIYQYIHRQGSATRSRIEHHTGLTMSTLVRALSKLENSGLVYVSDTEDSDYGRKPRIYRVCPDAGFVIGLDISRTYTRVALMNLELHILQSSTFGMYVDNTPEDTINRIIRIINELIGSLDKDKILGIGLGVVGPFDAEKELILNPSNFYAAGWKNVPIKRILHNEFNLPVYMDDGANTAALGEYRKGCAISLRNIAYLISGVGLRLGVIANGKLLKHLGSFAHTIVDMDGVPCSCGQKGCVINYISIDCLLKEYIEQIKSGRHSTTLEKIDFDLNAITFDHFCNAVQSGDHLAYEILRKSAGYLAPAINNVIQILNPDIIILGGPVFRKCPHLFTLVYELLSANQSVTTIFSMGELGADAITIGAGSLVLEDFFK